MQDAERLRQALEASTVEVGNDVTEGERFPILLRLGDSNLMVEPLTEANQPP